MRKWWLLYVAIILFFWGSAWAENTSVYPGYVEKIIDADTFRMSVLVWPTIIVQANVRLAGIDAPESIRPKCAHEKELAEKAKILVQALLNESKGRVLLHIIPDADKYGRTSAVIITKDGADIGAELLKAGLARPYTGKSKRLSWCNEKKQEEEKKFSSGNRR